MGDSISAAYGMDPQVGWVNLLAGKIAQEKKPYQVINASISGDLTINGLVRLPRLLKKFEPEIVIIELGGNDGLRGVPLDSVQDNIERMVKKARAANAKVLLAGMRIPPNYGPRYTEAFHNIYHKVAQKFEVTFVPFILEGVGGHDQYMQADGIHPNEKGQPIISELVWNKLNGMLK